MPLGSADAFAVLAGGGVASAGISTIYGDVGSGASRAVQGFPPGTVRGTIHDGDAVAAQAQADLSTAYDDATERTGGGFIIQGDIGRRTFSAGLYGSATSLEISSGDVMLDAQGDTNAIFIFRTVSTLTTTSGRRVILSRGTQTTNVYWLVGSSATLGAGTIFEGTILARTSITLLRGATLHGRALARDGKIALDENVIAFATLPEPPRFGPLSRSPGGLVTLVITNTPGRALRLESSANLIDWSAIATFTLAHSPGTVTDGSASPAVGRFYRVYYPSDIALRRADRPR